MYSSSASLDVVFASSIFSLLQYRLRFHTAAIYTKIELSYPAYIIIITFIPSNLLTIPLPSDDCPYKRDANHVCHRTRVDQAKPANQRQ